MSNPFDDLNGLFEGAQQQIKALREDPRYTEQHKAEQTAAIQADARARGQALVETWAGLASSEVEEAARDFGAAMNEWQGAQDYARQGVVNQEAEAFTRSVRDFGAVQAAVSEALVSRDFYRLRSLANVALPGLLERAAADGSPFRSHVGQLEQLAANVEAAMSDLEPERLKKARARQVAAQERLNDLHTAAARVNWRSEMRGMAAPLHTGNGFLDARLAPDALEVEASARDYRVRQRWP